MNKRNALRLGVTVGVALTSVAISGTAMADEPKKVTEPSVMRESTEITQVADAFDDDDPFDLHLSLGYQYTTKNSNVYRESAMPQVSTGGYTRDDMGIAKYSELTHRLNTRAEIGVFKDIALIFRVPIILSNERKLDPIDENAPHAITLMGAPGEQLFRLPFRAPKRSGVEYLAVGLDFGIMNQYRSPSKPTWVIGVEGRFDVSEPMHACNADPQPLNQPNGQINCARPSDINRDGAGDGVLREGFQLEGTFDGGRKPGVSRGVTGLELHTYLSKRIKYIEPYGGFRALIEFQNSSSDYGGADLKGSLVNHPPLTGTMMLGLSVIPWEVRDQYQRLTLDFRLEGSYRSEGRDYSELYDALGSSDAPSLRYPKWAAYTEGPNDPTTGLPTSVVDPGSQRVYFSGLTDVQQHGIYTVSSQVTWQAGEYIKFNLGGSYTIVQSHYITFDQACNPDFKNDASKAGPCQRIDPREQTASATGIPNPNYRVVVNVPGRRFRVDKSNAMSGWINATVMF